MTEGRIANWWMSRRGVFFQNAQRQNNRLDRPIVNFYAACSVAILGLTTIVAIFWFGSHLAPHMLLLSGTVILGICLIRFAGIGQSSMHIAKIITQQSLVILAVTLLVSVEVQVGNDAIL